MQFAPKLLQCRVYSECFTNPIISMISLSSISFATFGKCFQNKRSINGRIRWKMVQNYMKNKKLFPYAIVAGFIRE